MIFLDFHALRVTPGPDAPGIRCRHGLASCRPTLSVPLVPWNSTFAGLRELCRRTSAGIGATHLGLPSSGRNLWIRWFNACVGGVGMINHHLEVQLEVY